MNWEALQPGFDPDEIAGPWGPIDPEVLCLVVERQGRPAAAMVNFGLHPAILAGDNWLYSADYPGYLAEAMKRIVGDDFTCLLANGCCGNVNHVDYADRNQGRGFSMTQRVGYMLAAAANEAIRNRTPVAGDRVAARSDRVAFDRIQITPEQRAWSERRCSARPRPIRPRARSTVCPTPTTPRRISEWPRSRTSPIGSRS